MGVSMKIVIIPVVSVNSTILEYLVSLISELFNTCVEVETNIPVEIFSKDKHRGQYLSTNILGVLSKMKASDENLVLGVADIDLYVPSLNFVFGEADPVNRVAVISSARLRPSFYGLQDNDCLFLKRTGKEAVHELGHVFKLRHCINSRCVMFFSNSLEDTDLKGDDFCQRCRSSLVADL
jgi:archaemetzincin